MNALALSFFTLAIFVVSTQSGVTVLFEFKMFDNTGGRAFQKNTLCDGGEWFHRCETYFELCIKPTRKIPDDLSDCWYYLNTSRSHIWKDNIDFEVNDVGVPRVIKIQKETWPVDIGFFFKAWDWDGPDASKSTLIDTHSFWRGIPAGSNGTVRKFDGRSIGRRPNLPTTRLTFQIQVMCDVGYFGPDCKNYCDFDSVGNHSKCDNNGSVICEYGWYKEPMCDRFCVPGNDSESGYYTCSKDGARVCRANWHNPPGCKTFCVPINDSRIGHFLCAKDGSRLCLDNWMGEFCNVSKIIETRELTSVRRTDGVAKRSRLLIFSRSFAVSSNMLTPSYQIPSKMRVVSTSSAFSSKHGILQSRMYSPSVLPSNSSKRGMKGSKTIISYLYSSAKYSRLEPDKSAQPSFLLHVESTLEEGTSKAKLLEPKTTPSSLRTMFPGTSESTFQSQLLLYTSNDVWHIQSSSSEAKKTSSGAWYSATINVQGNDSWVPPLITNDKGINKELEWLIKSSRGNMALIGFSLALLFFVLFVMALCKIHRLTRRIIRRIQATDESALNSLHQMDVIRNNDVEEAATKHIMKS